MMSSKSKQKLKFFDTSKMNKLKHEIENENQHYAVAVFGLGLLIMMLEVIKHCRWSASDTSGP